MLNKRENMKSKLSEMASKKDLRSYFATVQNKQKVVEKKSVGIREMIVSETNVANNADVDMARSEVKKQVKHRQKYQTVPGKVKIEIGRYALLHGTQAALKKFSKIHPKYDLKRTSINTWKEKCKTKKESALEKLSGRPTLLSNHLIRKAKDIIIGARNAGTVISRRMVMAIGTGDVLTFYY